MSAVITSHLATTKRHIIGGLSVAAYFAFIGGQPPQPMPTPDNTSERSQGRCGVW